MESALIYSNILHQKSAHLFSRSITTGIFPEVLKSIRIVTIFKTGNPTLCDNYRPVFPSLTQSLKPWKSNHLELSKLINVHQYCQSWAKETMCWRVLPCFLAIFCMDIYSVDSDEAIKR
jgi:hypothetical protein